MYHHHPPATPAPAPHNQLHFQHQQTIGGGTKRHFSTEQTENFENGDQSQSAAKRFHPMESKENEKTIGKEERAEESEAEEEEESNSSCSDADQGQLQQRTTAVAPSNSMHVTTAARSDQSLANILATAPIISTMAQPPYQSQNVAQNFSGERTNTLAHQQQLRIDLQNFYQMRPLCADNTGQSSTNILRNIQNFYYPSVFNPAGGQLQQQQQSYEVVQQAKAMEEQRNMQMMAQQQPMFSFGHAAVAHSGHYAVSPFAQQMASSRDSISHHQQFVASQQQPITTMPNRQMTDKGDESTNNDSGLGLTDRSGKGDVKNESTSTDDSANLSTGDQFAGAYLPSGTVTESEPTLVPFCPFMRSVSIDGVQQYRDLELIVYSETPARLALLGNMSKYQITLAEIVRRVSHPECLNTSFLSGILRRAKNKDGGKRFRMELQRFNCGVDLQTGRRKTGAITTFTALCERESLQLANDFDKLAKDEQHGFPDKELAIELCRRADITSMGKQNCKQFMDNFQNAKILRDGIQLLEGAIEKETGELTSVNPTVQQQQQTNEANDMERNLWNRFKRFARMSHCFGNRAMLTSWKCLLSVFGNCELLLQQVCNHSQTELQQQKALTASADFSPIFQPQGQGEASTSNWMLP